MGTCFRGRQFRIKFKCDYRNTNWFHWFNNIPTYRVAWPLQLRLTFATPGFSGEQTLEKGLLITYHIGQVLWVEGKTRTINDMNVVDEQAIKWSWKRWDSESRSTYRILIDWGDCWSGGQCIGTFWQRQSKCCPELTRGQDGAFLPSHFHLFWRDLSFSLLSLWLCLIVSGLWGMRSLEDCPCYQISNSASFRQSESQIMTNTSHH